MSFTRFIQIVSAYKNGKLKGTTSLLPAIISALTVMEDDSIDSDDRKEMLKDIYYALESSTEDLSFDSVE